MSIRSLGFLFFCIFGLSYCSENANDNNETTNECVAERGQSGGEVCGNELGDCPSILCTCGTGEVSTSACFNGTCLGSEVCDDVCDADGGWECACMPDCAEAVCGDDGCGGSCGTCSEGSCSSGKCQTDCTPSCGDAVCGDDGCGGSCGTCDDGSCSGGKCVEACNKTCGNNSCGEDDGCGGKCSSCSAAGESCVENQCKTTPRGSCFAEFTKRFVCSENMSTSCDSWLITLTATAGGIVGREIQSEVVDGCQCGNSAGCAPAWWTCDSSDTSCSKN